MQTTRLEAFPDGVVAIIIVLKRGHELAGVLAPVERRLLKVVSG